ncbi:MAG: alpha-L-fucosidase [Bacteroidota bacterium]
MKNILYAFFISLMLIGCQPQGQNKEQQVVVEPITEMQIPAYLKENEAAYEKNPRQANIEWFKEAKFGLFMHYGLYSLLGKGEWVQLKDTIPVTEYALLQDKFTAENFDADFITDLAIEAGMKYITITSKHHDGFCLFKTNETDFNVINAPAKKDLINELYQACEEKGLGLFLYYSYAADWKHPYFYPRENGWSSARPAYEEPQPEYKFSKDEDFKIYVDFVHNQLKELFAQYPNIAGIWFDPIMGYYHRPDLFPIEETYALIRSLSPHALISFKQGANGTEDYMAPERSGKAKVGVQFEVAKKVYELNKDKPREICNTMQPHLKGFHGGSTWGYNKALDGKHLNADQVMELLSAASEMDANLLLNVGPKPDGSFPQEDIDALREVGKRLKAE